MVTNLRRRRPFARIMVAALVVTGCFVLRAASATASPDDRIAPVTAASSTTYTQTFARADGAVHVTYTVDGERIAQDSADATGVMDSRGASVGFSPEQVKTSTGAALAARPSADCAGGAETATDCGASGTVTIAFDRPVTDPTLHLSGLGDQQDAADFAAYVDLSASASTTAADDSAALTRLLGDTTNLQLTPAGRLQTIGVRPSAGCDDTGTTGSTSTAGCGSVLVTGDNLTSITLTVGVRNAGGGTGVLGTTRDAFLLDLTIPQVSGAGAELACAANSVYAVHGSDWNIDKVDVNTGAEAFVGHVNAAPGTTLDGLAVAKDGSAAYAMNRIVSAGGTTTVYRLDPVTGETASYQGPTLAHSVDGSVTEAALDPVNGIYYVALVGDDGLEVYGFDTATSEPITGRIAHFPSITRGTGDFAFDRLGRMVFTASTGDGTATANPLYHLTAPLPATGDDATLSADVVGYLTPDDSTLDGLAFDLPQGNLYVNSSTGGRSTLRQLNPTSGAEVASHPITYSGQATDEVTDLASCNYDNSLQLQQNIVSRANVGDQFTATLTGGGLGVAQHGTTSGSATGVQTGSDATAGPIATLAGTDYTITETAADSDADLSRYLTTWKCVNLLTTATVVSGTGATGTFAFPTPATNDGIPLGCSFTNEAIASSIAISETADQAAYRVGETVTYAIAVTNTGNSTLTSVTVSDPTDARCGRAIGALAAGAGTTYTCTDTAPVAGDADTATVTGTDPLDRQVSASSTATVTTNRPSLLLTASADPTAVTTAGQTVAFRFDVTNTGNTTIEDVAVTGVLSAPAGPASTPSCAQTSLLPGASTTCTADYTVSRADLDHGSIDNTAVAHGQTPDDTPVDSPSSTASIAVTQQPALSLQLTAAAADRDHDGSTDLGDTLTWTIVVTNPGNVTLTDVVVSDRTVGPVTCPSTTVVAGASTQCTATQAITQADVDRGRVDNTANASGAGPDGRLLNSTTANVSTPIDSTNGLQLVQTPSPTTVSNVGQQVSYTFMVTNTGTTTLTGVQLSDTLSAPARPALALSCPSSTVLAPGATLTCTADHTSTQADFDHGSISNTVSASAGPPSGRVVRAGPSITDVATTQTAQLGLVKRASVTDANGNGYADLDDTVRWAYVVANSGTVTLDRVAVRDRTAGTVWCPTTTLTAGLSMTCTAVSLHVISQADVDAGTVGSSAVAGAHSAHTGDDVVTSNLSSTSTPIGARPSLILVKTGTLVDADNDTVVNPGNKILWSFLMTNTGNVTLSDLHVDDPRGGRVTCRTGSLSPGLSTTCKADKAHTVTSVDVDLGSVSNTAHATGTPPGAGPVDSPATTATVALPERAALTLLNTARVSDDNGDGANGAGDTLTWQFRVFNNGNVTITDVRVVDPTAGPVGCAYTTLAPGASTSCVSRAHTISQREAAQGRLINTATAAGRKPSGSAITSPPSSATVTIGTVAGGLGGSTAPGSTGGGGFPARSTDGVGGVAYTGAGSLPLLIWSGVSALLLGLLVMVAGAGPRRRRAAG